MTDNRYFDVVPARSIAPAPAGSTAARGDGWRVERQQDGVWLFYISGEERAIFIDDADADTLAKGSRTLDDVLIARGAS